MRYTANAATRPMRRNTKTDIQRCETTRSTRESVIVPTRESAS